MRKKKREKLERLKREKEFKAKIHIKKTLSKMKKQSRKLDEMKKSYIDKAKRATEIDNDQIYKMARSGLKICLNKQKYLDSMVINFELAIEMNDMNKIIGSFVKGINSISEEMELFTSSVDLVKARDAFDQAMANNLSQYEALDAFISTTAESFDSIDIGEDDISDEEVDALVKGRIASSEDELDNKINLKLDEISKELI